MIVNFRKEANLSLEAMASLMGESASAAKVLMQVTAQARGHSVLVASNAALAELTQLSVPTVKRALKLLQERRWINILRLGQTQSVRAIIVNNGASESQDLQGASFSAMVYLTEAEQDADEIASNQELHKLPAMYAAEKRYPS